MFIAIDNYVLLIPFMIPYVTNFSVANGVADSGCPIYVKIVCRYSPLHQFLNWGPILDSISDISNFLIILNYICKSLFGYDIKLGCYIYIYLYIQFWN